jgi:hypothetical protein
VPKNFWLACFGIFLLMTSAPPARAQRGDETFFELKIRPILADKCFKCHGGKKVSQGLRVDSRAALLKGGESGPAVIPGDADKSLLIQALRYTHAEIKMPPDRRLPDKVVADFATWVQQGAAWPATSSRLFSGQKHWAFEPVRSQAVPATESSGGSDNPVDRFILAKLHEQGLHAVGQTDKRTLLRRVTFDLLGLPPRPEEMAGFLADDSPTAFARVVERLLASPQYGERWGRHWMDVAHYADTAGDNADYPIPEIRLYRDYIIDAFNSDKPYDRFVQEQLAGDLLARQSSQKSYSAQIIATGFLALSRRYATAPYELWHLTLEDAIETTGRTFLGLTLRCARCHDHKFDPVTKEDYYALYGIFASTQFPWAGAEEFASMKRPREHFAPLLAPEQTGPNLAAFQAKIKRLDDEIQKVEKSGPKEKLEALRNERWNIGKAGLPRDMPAAYAVQDGKPGDARVQMRGEVEQQGPVVKRGMPKFLAADQCDIPANASGRLQLAQWLTRPDNPLTARVMVNRLWQHHFGKGIVTTPSNFGLRGDEPTHPELLAWLAARFVDSGWSIKALHRLILLSRTYQLSSSHDEVNAVRDPGNRWYWRFDRRRLDAEAIRDTMLALSGKLDLSRPGPHPFPPMDKWTWTQHNPFKEVYPSDHRSVYLMTQRLQRHPYLVLFDGPDTNTSTEQRTSATVPQQALFLMNNPFVRTQAEGFARTLMRATNDPRQRVQLAYDLAFSRAAKPIEVEKGLWYIDEYARQLAQIGISKEHWQEEAWTSFARTMLCANEFVYVD